MTTMIIGMVLFFGIHLVPFTPAKPSLQAAMGEMPYKGVFALVAAIGLGLMIWGFGLARSGAEIPPVVYDAPAWGRHAAQMVMLPASILLAAIHGKGWIKNSVKHPMSSAIALWAIAHLLVNGSLHEVLFFGAFLAFALLDIVVNTARGRIPRFEHPRILSDIIAVVLGLVLYGVFIWLHPVVVGAPVM